MKFINKGEPVKIRQGKFGMGCYWITLRTNDIIDLPKKIGRNNHLTELKTTEGQIGDQVVETKQIEDFSKIKLPEFEEELTKIKGIGAKTAWDITKVYSTKEELINALGKGLPFRDDVVEKLKEEYGK